MYSWLCMAVVRITSARDAHTFIGRISAASASDTARASPADAGIEKGQTIPNTKFGVIPWAADQQSGKVCGVPTTFNSHEQWKGKKVVVVSIPGAFTPVCHQNHIPGFIQKAGELKKKGVDAIVVLASNDPFVMSGWRVTLGAKDQVEFVTDVDEAFSKALNATVDMSKKGLGMGTRTARYALLVDDLKAVYFGEDPGDMSLDKASVESVEKHL
ncbi:peroxiredoxin type-2 [Malassezia sp. CBS 17886]|nr:peroxiredoxin type-2 [Malassezia sp. CBS 17886]